MKLSLPYSSLLALGLLMVLAALSYFIPQDLLRLWVETAGFLGPLVLIGLTVISCILAPISGSPMLFLGYILYGEKTVWYSAVAGWLSYSLNFAIARKWGRPGVIRMVGVHSMQKIDKFATAYGWGILFFLRVFAGGVHDFISYAMGLSAIPYRTYIGISTLGAIPGTMLWYFLANKISNPMVFILTTWAMLAVLSGIFLLYFRYFGKPKKPTLEKVG